jgi:2-isopropylmalate synthase
MKFKLGKSPSEVLQSARECVRLSRSIVEDVEFSCEDGTRSEWEFLRELIEAVIEEGATTINVPDTVGYTTPLEYSKLFQFLKSNVKDSDKVIFSAHCHNDLGLAVANSLAAIDAGARQIECTINGIGERAGNTAMEEVVMALRTRKNYYGIQTNIDTTQITRGSYLVKNITGMVVQPNKAIVGANAFAHESGIHQDGVLKHRETYEIMTPESVGLASNKMVIGRHSGRAGFKDRVTRLGLKFDEKELESLYQRFLEVADKKKEMFDEDILALAQNSHSNINKEKYKLVYFKIQTGTDTTPNATVHVEVDSVVHKEEASGDGPVDGIFKAINRISRSNPLLSRLVISPVTEGSDAMAEASVTLEFEGKRVVGKGSSTDILEACALSYINALNRI